MSVFLRAEIDAACAPQPDAIPPLHRDYREGQVRADAWTRWIGRCAIAVWMVVAFLAGMFVSQVWEVSL